MKNSLFKRAIAAATVVPVALTQCLGVTYAVENKTVLTATDGATLNAITLDNSDPTSILYIAPEGKYSKDGNTFIKDSNWNSLASKLFLTETEATLDLSEVYEKAIEKSGEFAEVTKSLVEKISDVNYKISTDGTITISGSLDNITPTFTAGGSNTIGGALKELADKYGVEDLDAPDNFFEDVVIAGDLEIVIDGSQLMDGTTVTAKSKFTDKASGKVYENEAVVDWALEQFDVLKNTAKAACDKYSQYVDTTDAYAEIEDSVAFYVDKLELAKEYIAKAYSVNKTLTAADVPAAIAMANEKLESKFDKKLPATCTEIVSKDIVASLYANILNQVNAASPIAINISATDLATFADTSLKNIVAEANNGTYTLNATFADKEAEAATAYIENEYNVEVLDIYKEITIVADPSASVDIQIKRIVETEPNTVVTTTTTDSAPVTTTTTDDTIDPTVTTTTDGAVDPTVTTTTDGAVDPTVTTTTDGAIDPTVTTTTDGAIDPTVTTTTDGAVDPTVTTTTDGAIDPTVTTTTDGAIDPTVTTTDGAVDPTVTTTDGAVDPTVTTTTDGAVDPTVTTTTDGAIDPTVTTTTDGAIDPTVTTTTDAPVVTSTDVKYVINYETETNIGFYLDIDEEFKDASVRYSLEKYLITYDAEGNVISEDKTEETGMIDISDAIEFQDKPSDAKELVGVNPDNQFEAYVQVYASKDVTAPDGTVIIKAGDALKNPDGTPFTVTAYIGLKGDANLDMTVDSNDASAVLVFYAALSTGGTMEDTNLCPNEELVNANPILDDFAAFLADVDNENDSNNNTMLKNERVFSSSDASFILMYYTETSTGADTGRETWNEVLGNYAKKD